MVVAVIRAVLCTILFRVRLLNDLFSHAAMLIMGLNWLNVSKELIRDLVWF